MEPDTMGAAADFPHPPPSAVAAIETLIALDPDFSGILERAGALPWRRRASGFPGLLQAIVAQMISNQAAAAIWGRLRAIPGAMDPALLVGMPDDTPPACRARRSSMPRRWRRRSWTAR
jgi:DNA-3-methyladenine glycosylase II